MRTDLWMAAGLIVFIFALLRFRRAVRESRQDIPAEIAELRRALIAAKLKLDLEGEPLTIALARIADIEKHLVDLQSVIETLDAKSREPLPSRNDATNPECPPKQQGDVGGG